MHLIHIPSFSFYHTSKVEFLIHVEIVDILFLPMRQSLFIFFGGAGKFCLAHGLGQLTRDIKSDDRTLNFRNDGIFAPSGKISTFRKGRNAT